MGIGPFTNIKSYYWPDMKRKRDRSGHVGKITPLIGPIITDFYFLEIVFIFSDFDNEKQLFLFIKLFLDGAFSRDGCCLFFQRVVACRN